MEDQSIRINNEDKSNAFVRSSISYVSDEDRSADHNKNMFSDISNIDLFRERLEKYLMSTMPARDMVFFIVKSALEIELGPNFTLMNGSDKMIRKIADSVLVNPQLRRQALSISTNILDKKINIGNYN